MLAYNLTRAVITTNYMQVPASAMQAAGVPPCIIFTHHVCRSCTLIFPGLLGSRRAVCVNLDMPSAVWRHTSMCAHAIVAFLCRDASNRSS